MMVSRISITRAISLADAVLELHPEQALRLDGELHGQLAEDVLAEAVDDERDGVLLRDAALLEVEQLLLADARGRRLVLDARRVVHDLDVRERVRARAPADEHRVALRVVARALRPGQHLDEPAVRVVRLARRDALRDDGRARVLPDVDHLRAGVGLLRVVRQGDRVELADGVVALQDARGVLPRNRRAGLDLRPRDLRVAAAAGAALRDEVVDAALALFVAGVPVLHRAVLDLRIIQRDELDDGGVELVRVALRRRAPLEVADARPLVGDDERALELA